MHKFFCVQYEDFWYLVDSTTNIVWKVLCCNNFMSYNNLQLIEQSQWTFKRFKSIIFYSMEIRNLYTIYCYKLSLWGWKSRACASGGNGLSVYRNTFPKLPK